MFFRNNVCLSIYISNISLIDSQYLYIYLYINLKVPNECKLVEKLYENDDVTSYCCQCSWTMVEGGEEKIITQGTIYLSNMYNQ
jgi:hypothetical protein